jgi:hypothetical protein
VCVTAHLSALKRGSPFWSPNGRIDDSVLAAATFPSLDFGIPIRGFPNLDTRLCRGATESDFSAYERTRLSLNHAPNQPRQNSPPREGHGPED